MSERSTLVGVKSSSRSRRGAAPRRLRERRDLAPEGLESRRLLAVAITPDVYVALEGTPLTVAAPGVLGNDTSTTDSAITVTNFTQPTDGTVTLNQDGAFVYTPTAGYTGPDQFTYTATDARGASGTATVQLRVNATTEEASVFAGTRLASVDSTQGALLNAVLGGLVGTNLDLTAVDYTGLAGASLDGGRLADALAAELDVTPSQALTTNATLAQVFTAAATAASGDGDAADAAALNTLAASVGGITAPVQLGNLIQASTGDGSLTGASINALDLVNGTAQLFNSSNVATTPTPITVSAAALGLPGVVSSVAISAQVVEPPVLTTGPAGTQFHSAAIRLRTDLNLDENLDTTALTTALAAPLRATLGALVTPTATATLNNLSVYAEIAEGQGTISAINALANAVTLQATPGLADVYVGNIADNLFFDRAHVIDPTTDVTPATVGTLDVGATVAGTSVLNQSTGIQARSVALGDAPTASTEVFNAPFPQSQTVSTGATFLTDLANTLTNNLTVSLSGSLGTVLDPLVNSTILPALKPVVTDAVTPLLTPALADVVQPALQDLGTGLGQLDLTVNAVNAVAAPAANADFATTLEDQGVVVPVLANDATVPGQTLTITAISVPGHGTAQLDPDGTITYTPTAGYFGPDSFSYTVTDPAGQASTATVTAGVLPLAPVAAPDTYAADQGTPLTVAGPGVLGNDTDPDGLPLTALIAANPTRGTVTLNADGSFTYTPTAGDSGPDTFTYQASNGSTLSNPVTVTLDVAPALPTANPDAYTATAGRTLTLPAAGVLANDTDPNGLPLSAVVAAGPAHGTLTLNADGSLAYTPAAGYVGPDSFTYTASDGDARSAPVAVNLTVNAASPPVVTTFPVTGTAGVPIVAAPIVTYTDGDGSNPPGSYTATINWGDGTSPSAGTVTESNGVYEVSGDHTYAQVGTYPVAVTIAGPGADRLSATAPAAIAPAAPATASLAGTVYLDYNKNGRDDSNEYGIADVVLTLTGTGASGQAVSMTATTDSSGHYEFAGLPTGTYTIQVTNPTSIFNRGQATPGTDGGTPQGGAVAGINFTAAADATGYDFGELIRPGCRLATPAFRTLLRVGPTAALPSTFRAITVASGSPIATYLPTLAARAAGGATVASVPAHQVKVAVAHATSAHHAVKVQHARPKPKPHAAPRHK